MKQAWMYSVAFAAAAAAAAAGADDAQHVLGGHVLGGSSAAPLFRCDLPPAVAPDGGVDGLPAASALFAGAAALARQVERHAAIVRVPTVCYDDMGAVDEDPRWEPFRALHRVLEELFPAVHARMARETVNGLGLVYTLAGREPGLRPMLLTAHQDVVPVADASTWTHPPFGGHFDGTWLWGRGASDDKSSLTAVLSVAEALLAHDNGTWTPRRTLVVALGFDEETSGQRGARAMAAALAARHGPDSMVLLLDEGGRGTQTRGNVLYALTGVAEKGHVNVLYELRVPGGHSSVPRAHSGIGIAAEVVTALEAHPYAPRLLPDAPLLHHYACKARYSPDDEPEITRLVRAGDLDALAARLAAQDGATRFLMQTSQSVDLIEGGVKINAMPELVTLGVNYRVALHSSIDEVKQTTRRLVQPIADKYGLALRAFGDGEADLDLAAAAAANGSLVITAAEETPVAPLTPTDGPVWDLFAGTIRHALAADGRLVVPVGDAMNGNTDTRHYHALTRNIFRWTPVADDASANIHTVDERINMHAHLDSMRFYYDLLRNFDAADV